MDRRDLPEMTRRDLLKAGAAGGAAGGVFLLGVYLGRNPERERGPDAGSDDEQRRTPAGPTVGPDRPTATPESASSRFEGQYGDVVDAVDAGADPEGEEPINDFLASHAADDTLLAFPAGSYRVRPMTLSGYSNLGIAGTAGERPTFFGDPGSFSGNGRFLIFEDVADFLLDGVDFDFCRGDEGGKLTLRANGDAVIRNVEVAASCSSHLQVLGISIQDEAGVGLVENFRATNRGSNKGITGVYVAKPHIGELTFRDCELRGFTDNGLYASAPGLPGGEDGVVHVEGGTYDNNNVSNVRLGSTGSTVRNVSVTVDRSPPVEPVNARGIRLRRQNDQIVENCRVYFGPDAGESFGAIVFHPDNGGALVKDTRITVDRDGVPGVFAPYNATSFDTSPVLENVTIDGDASGGYAANFVGRENVVLRNCRIEATGENRNGVRIANNDGGRIIDCHIDVPGIPVVIDDATAEVRNTTIVGTDGERVIEQLTVTDETVLPST